MAIQVEDLCYTYGEGTALERQALKHVSFEIQDGEFVGLIGHTGSGKSTLIQHLNGLIKPTSGDIKYQGVSIYSQGYKLKDLRSKVGLVFQYPEYQLFEADIFTDVCFGPKNLGLPQEEVEKRARHALKLVGMDEKFYKQSPFELSGGQKRRVAIAGVLAMRPEMMILDEPTAGLDPQGRDEILGQIERLNREHGLTILVVSHSMEDMARYVDRIMVMNDGVKMFDDTPKEVFRHYKELEAIGLAAPQITYVVQGLRERGIPIDDAITTVEEAEGETMIRDITIGQYYPVESVVHRLDPRTKLFGTLIYIISLFFADNLLCYAVATVFLAMAVRASRVPFKFIVRGLKAIVFLLLISISFNLFLTNGRVIFRIGFLKVTHEGLRLAVFMGLRLMYLVIGSSVMTLTTTPNQLTDGLEKSLGCLNRIHVPVHEISMMMSIALRFIPILIEETDKIMKAQMARGADFESGNLVQRAKSMIPILVPLFVSAFRRATDLAMAMEARCYRGGSGRTKMKPLHYEARDRVTYLILLVYLGIVIALRILF